MSLYFKKLFFAITFNSCLFLILITGIQNSSLRSKVNFLKARSIELPVSFIVGSSFISGSILGSLLPVNFHKKGNNLKSN